MRSAILFYILCTIPTLHALSQEEVIVNMKREAFQQQQVIFQTSEAKKTDSLPHLLGINSQRNWSAFTPDLDKVKRYLHTMPYVNNAGSLKEDTLISDYAFSKLIRTNFNKLILGADNSAKIGRYASLDLSKQPAFELSPFIFEPNPAKRPYTYVNIFAINVSGKLNAEGIFKLKEFRNLAISGSYVRIINKWTNYKPVDRPDNIKNAYKARFETDLDALINKYEGMLAGFASAEEEKVIDAEKKLETIRELYEKITDLEIAKAEDFWASRNIWWYYLGLKLSWDKVKYLSTPKLQSNNYSTTDYRQFVPSVTGSFNYYTQRKQGSSLLFSLWAGVQRRHSLSEVFEPEDFQPFRRVHDSVMQLKTMESVFVTDMEQLDTKVTLDFGFRCVTMLNLSKIRKKQIGFSLAFSRVGLVTDGNFPSLFRTETGLVIPFLKEDGTSTFNLELFYRTDVFSNFDAVNDKFVGARFNVPISSL